MEATGLLEPGGVEQPGSDRGEQARRRRTADGNRGWMRTAQVGHRFLSNLKLGHEEERVRRFPRRCQERSFSSASAGGQSKQAADDGDRWPRFPGKFKPVVEEAIGYHGDWLGGMGRRWGGAVFC